MPRSFDIPLLVLAAVMAGPATATAGAEAQTSFSAPAEGGKAQTPDARTGVAPR